MSQPSIIPEVPKPPRRRLPFPLLLYRMIANPVESWAQEFYERDIVVYRRSAGDTVFVMNPDLVQQVLLTNADAFARVYSRVFGRGGSEGLIIAEGERWRWQRQLLAPLFRPEEVTTHIPTFVSAAEPLLKRWSEAPPGSLQDIHADMADVSLKVLEDTVLGAALSPEDHKRVAAAVIDFLKPLTWKAAYAALKLPSKTPHPGRTRRALAIRDLGDVASRAIAKRRKSGAEPTDVLGRLVTAIDPANGRPMADTLIIDNLMTFLVAGHETTANALTWTLYVLSMFPEWQERAREEVRRVAPDGKFGRKEIEQLTLVDEILHESMRLYPPIADIIRTTRKPVTLGGEEIRQGANIVVPIYVIHRHRRVWDNPLLFDPSRFRGELKARVHRCAFMPFGAGPRTCIGAAFSILEGRTLLAAMLARARFELPQGVKPFPIVRLSMRPKHGLKLKVTML
jgi:cytochrome P450